MTKEQEEAIEYLKKYTKWETYGERNLEKDIITILNLVDKLQKENEELKRENEELKVLEDDIQEKRIAYIDEPEFEENYISKKKVKDKIEEYKNMLKTCNKAKDIDRIKAINERILELQELIEGEK